MTRTGHRSEGRGAARARAARAVALLAALLLCGCGALSGLSGRGAPASYPQTTADTPAGPPRPLDRAAG